MSKPNKFVVDVDFIREAHSAACGEWKIKLERKFPEAFDDVAIYHTGDRFIYESGSEFILSNVYLGLGENYVSLTRVDTGNCWDKAIKVKTSSKVTRNEWKELVGESYVDKFRRKITH